MDREKTISELLSFYPTWDNFSLSILYLKTFYFMFPKGFHRNSLLLFFSQMLLFNIHPDPRRRYTLEETKQKFKDIFFMEENVENYIDLLTTFDYDVGYATKVINVDINNMGHTRAMMKLHKKWWLFVIWTYSSFGPIHHLDLFVIWTYLSFGPIHHLDLHRVQPPPFWHRFLLNHLVNHLCFRFEHSHLSFDLHLSSS